MPAQGITPCTLILNPSLKAGVRNGGYNVFLVSYPLSYGKRAGGIGRQMTQKFISSFEANYVCLTTLSVLHISWSAPYLLIYCLHTFLPIPRPAGGPFLRGRGFAICDDLFLKTGGASLHRHLERSRGSLLHCGNQRVCAVGKRCPSAVSHQAMTVLQ